MSFGLYDTDDGLWMGNEQGPRLYESEKLAQVVARIVDGCLHQRTGRTRAMPFKGVYAKLRDEKLLLENPVEVLAGLEEGRL